MRGNPRWCIPRWDIQVCTMVGYQVCTMVVYASVYTQVVYVPVYTPGYTMLYTRSPPVPSTASRHVP